MYAFEAAHLRVKSLPSWRNFMIQQMASLPRLTPSAALIGQHPPPLGPRTIFGESVSKRQESLHVSRFRFGWRTKVKLSLYDGLDKHWGKRQNPTKVVQGLCKNRKARGEGATFYASISSLRRAIPSSYIYCHVWRRVQFSSQQPTAQAAPNHYQTSHL